MNVYDGLNGIMVNGYMWFFLKKVKRTIERETGIRREASKIER